MALQEILDGTIHMASNLDMENNRIINAAHPRYPQDNADYDRDLITAIFFYTISLKLLIDSF